MEYKLTKSLYNADFKKKFIESYNNTSTQKLTESILAKAKDTEEVLKKDLYMFTLEEIKQTIRAANPLNKMSAYNIGRTYYRYILFAINEKKNNLNPLAGINPDWFINCVDRKRRFFTKDEINQIVGLLENEQDKAMIALYFEGANGRQNSELANLKKQDIDISRNELTLHNADHSVRTIKVSPWCIDLVDKAAKSLHYRATNRLRKKIIASVVDNDYVFRGIKRRDRLESAPMNNVNFYNRFNRIKKVLDLPYISPRTIQQSGMIYMGYKIAGLKRKLTREDYDRIATQFNVGNRILGTGNKKYLNISLFKNKVNEELIRKWYS